MLAILVIAPQNFRDEEYLKPKEILEKNGIKVLTASTEKKVCKGMLGLEVIPDITIDEIKDGDALILIGGSGSPLLFSNKTLINKINYFMKQGKIIGAICLAPIILINSGLIKDKKITGWAPECKIAAEKSGVTYTGEDVTIDGKLITASGPKAAVKFGEVILKKLKEMK